MCETNAKSTTQNSTAILNELRQNVFITVRQLPKIQLYQFNNDIIQLVDEALMLFNAI